MNSKQVYVFRHGDYKKGEITLDSREKAEVIGNNIKKELGRINKKLVKVISSDILRAKQTAEAISKGIGLKMNDIIINDALTLEHDDSGKIEEIFSMLKQLEPYQVLIFLTHQPIANGIALGLGYKGSIRELRTLDYYNFPLQLDNKYYKEWLTEIGKNEIAEGFNEITNNEESGIDHIRDEGLEDYYNESIERLDESDFGINSEEMIEDEDLEFEEEIDEESGVDQIRDEGLEDDYNESIERLDESDFGINSEEMIEDEDLEFEEEIDKESGIDHIRDEGLEDDYNDSIELIDNIIGDDRLEGIDQQDILQEIQGEKVEFLLSGKHKEVDELICKTLVSKNVSKEDILLVSLAYICDSRIQQRFNSVTYGALFFQKLLDILNSGDFYGYVNLESISKIYMYYKKNSKYLKDFDNVNFESTIDIIANTYIESILLNTNSSILQECNRLVLPINIHIRIFQVLSQEIGKITIDNIATHIDGGRFLSIILGDDYIENGVIKVLINNNKLTDTQSIEEFKKYLSFKLVEKYGSMGFIDSINNLVLPY